MPRATRHQPSPDSAVDAAQDAESRSVMGTLERGLGILEILRAATVPLSLTRIADEVGCDPSTALRVLRVLVRSEYAIRDAETRLYLPAPKALIPLSLYHPLNSFRRDTYALISGLREETGLTVAAVLFLRFERIVVDIVHGAERLSPYYETHLKRPVHSSATGKILLAALPQSLWPQVLGEEPYQSFTGNTRTTANQLASDIERAQSDGFATTVDEALVGLSAVAAPVRGKAGAIIGSIGVFGQSAGMANPAKHSAIGGRVKEVTELVSQTSTALQELGGLVRYSDSRHAVRARRV